MIIECQACRARFRLDESKIKGKGARIRCRKCGESIIVMKSDIPPPEMSPPAEKQSFDLRAVLQEPEKRPPLPARPEVDAAFESIKSRERETEQAHPPAPEEPPESSLTRDEAAAAFESILGQEREPEQVPTPVVEEPAAPAEEEKETFAQEPAEPSLTQDEIVAAFESPLFREEEEPSPQAAEEPAAPAEEEQETFAQEAVEPSLTQDEIDAAFENILGGERKTEQVPTPVVEEPALLAEEEKETFAQEPAEPSLPRDEADAAFESPLFREEEEQPSPVAEEPTPPLEEEREIPAQEPAEPSLTRDKLAAAFKSILGKKREPEQVPTPVVEEPAPPAEEEHETFAQEPAEPSLTRDEAAAFESPLFEEAYPPPPLTEKGWDHPGQHPTEFLGLDTALPDFLRKREEEEQPSPVAEEPALPAEEEKETFAREPMEEPPPHRDDIASDLDALLREIREKEAFAHEPAEPTLTRVEEDTAFESILGKKQESEQETPPVAEEWALPREAQDISFPLELGKEGDISSPQETRETPFRSPEDLAGGEAAKGPGKQFDISEQLSGVPIGVEGEDVAFVSPTPDSPESPAHSMDPAAARADTIRDQLSDLVESTSTEETSLPDSPPPEIPSPQPMEIERKPAIRPRPSAPSGKPSVALLALMFVILAGGGAYLAFTETGQKTLHTLIPGMESLWLGGKESVKPYSIGNLIGYYETGDKAGRMFVIKGVATNQGRREKSGIRIRAELLDGNHQTIAEKTVYAGNMINGLRSTEQEKIETAMSNRFGDKLSNVDVAPGKSVPFMLVFFDPPEGIEEYRLEALDGD